MLEFLRRIPEFLGLRLKPKAGSPPKLKVVPGGKGTGKAGAPEAKPEQRGRGTGRGVTPPTHAKRGAARQGRKK